MATKPTETKLNKEAAKISKVIDRMKATVDGSSNWSKAKRADAKAALIEAEEALDKFNGILYRMNRFDADGVPMETFSTSAGRRL